MNDYGAIQNLKARYCQVADSSPDGRDEAIAGLAALFTDDVVADYGFGEMTGSAAIGAFLTDSIAGGSEWMVHNIHSPLIEIDGDEARGDWTVNVRMKRRTTGDVDFVFGRYSDRFRRVDGTWKIGRIGFRRYE